MLDILEGGGRIEVALDRGVKDIEWYNTESKGTAYGFHINRTIFLKLCI